MERLRTRRWRRIYISIHVPTRGTTVFPSTQTTNLSFQSTFPRGERQRCVGFGYGWIQFQSTFPQGERLLPVSPLLLIPLFQSTFPRGERQLVDADIARYEAISIHVPTRGTTQQRYNKLAIKNISIHVPTRGTTPLYLLGSSAFRISIHVPTRGTTASVFC